MRSRRGRWQVVLEHRDYSIHTRESKMHCHGFDCIRSFDVGFQSAEG